MNDTYFVYAISSKSHRYIYVGISNNIDRRLAEHNNGYNKTTKPYRPFKLIFQEKFDSRARARVKEKYLKGGSGKKFLYSRIDNL